MHVRSMISLLFAATAGSLVVASDAELASLSSVERQTLAQELVAWKRSPAAKDAEQLGLNEIIAAHESHSDVEAATLGYSTEELRRFQQAKQLVAEMEKQHPNADFTLASPFSLLTNDEFEQFVARSGLRGKQQPESNNQALLSFDDDDDLPVEVDWRQSGCLPPVKNQGHCGSCAYFSSTAAIEASMCMYQNGDLRLYSEQRTVSCFGGGCKGEWPHLVMEFVKEQGVCHSDDYPYTSGTTQQFGVCKLNSCKPEMPKIQNVVQVNTTESSLKFALRNRPTVIMLAAGNKSFKQYKSGILEGCGDAQMDHAVLLVGYDEQAWNIKNSWGASWGDNGFVRLRRGLADPLGACRVLEFNPVFPEF
ncbi:TPA: hypothetical protein N0F65_008331 [Lagenidium giganteum]|uniref:Peptidase C1A papain C-terminal domain-containing protein n=1 Tax=Lagenidium giganteum TaxID=4803 RepID=A0AAV2YSI5_9STRA|nr:TPA: hypothetical protein N0F65_008331 [Lagenidium giganteum]